MFLLMGKMAPGFIPTMIGVFSVIIGVFFFFLAMIVKAQKKKEREEERLRRQLAMHQQQLLEKQAQVMAEYSQQYEQRKLTIGTIKCTQCEWSGQWGTGMTYEQFFAGNLAESGIDVARRAVNNDNLSGDNRQYTCPVCNSSGWEKA